MNNLNDTQKQELVNQMNQGEDVPFARWAKWATQHYGFTITEAECNKLFMDAMFANTFVD